MGNTENANKRPKQVFSKSAFPLSEEVLRKRKGLCHQQDLKLGQLEKQIRVMMGASPNTKQTPLNPCPPL